MDENKTVYVADASVVLKWAINEREDLEQALVLKRDFVERKINIYVPSYCFAEVCNLLCRTRPNIAIPFFSFLIESKILECHLNINLVNIAYRLIRRYRDISFYDAAYHALAIQENGIFLTADIKYYNNTKREGSIMLLKDYGRKR